MTWDIELARESSELEQILELQRQNHITQVTPEQARAQGFVTAQHSLESLTGMHALAPSVVARAVPGGQLAGYALTMLREARALVPILEPMFQLLESLSWRGAPLAELDYYVMGQICVAEPFRGQGLLDALYRGHELHYAQRFELLVTEISTRNERSLRAHRRVGFEAVQRYRDSADEWLVVAWDWR
jgi:GNAT superfamily N-acetyltransferase